VFEETHQEFCTLITTILCETKLLSCDNQEVTPGSSPAPSPSPISSPMPEPTPFSYPFPTTTFTPSPSPSPTSTNLCTYDSECQTDYFTRFQVCCKQEGQTYGTCTDPSFCCDKERQNQLISQGMTTQNYCCATSCNGDYQIVPRGNGFRCPHKNNGNREFICVMPEVTCSQENHNQLDESGTKACCASTCYASNNTFHWVNIGEGIDCHTRYFSGGNPVNDSRVVMSNGNLSPYCIQPSKCDCEWSTEKSQESCMSDSNISNVIEQTLGISSPKCFYEQKECAI
jgi:hypothetical protein